MAQLALRLWARGGDEGVGMRRCGVEHSGGRLGPWACLVDIHMQPTMGTTTKIWPLLRKHLNNCQCNAFVKRHSRIHEALSVAPGSAVLPVSSTEPSFINGILRNYHHGGIKTLDTSTREWRNCGECLSKQAGASPELLHAKRRINL